MRHDRGTRIDLAASRGGQASLPRGLSAVGSRRVAVAAVVPRHARVYRRPGRRPFASFGALNQNRFPTVFRVLAALRRPNCHTSWYRVQVPMKPNGVTGFVPARDVRIGT